MTGLNRTIEMFLSGKAGYAELKEAYRNTAKEVKFFVLGGNDAEMVAIAALLSQAGQHFIQPKKEWGNHSYGPGELGLEVTPAHEEMHSQGGPQYPVPVPAAVKEYSTVVFVECFPADSWPQGTKAIVVDHHGELAYRPAAIRQVLDILEPTGFQISGETRRWAELIAANDSGYIPAMTALGATQDEVSRVRALDRSAQGITPAHEAEAERAISAKEVVGRLTVVRMAHSKTATVADRLYGQHDQLLIISGDGEVNFYGDGALCAELKTKFEGWNGGAGLGKTGANAYWGAGRPEQEKVSTFIREQLN